MKEDIFHNIVILIKPFSDERVNEGFNEYDNYVKM